MGKNDFSKQILESCNRILTPRECKILELRLGLDNGEEKTLQEVATYFDVTRERIRQKEALAIEKICSCLESFYWSESDKKIILKK